MIEITESQIDRVYLILHGVPGGAEKALAEAINRGISRAKTVTVQNIGQVYAVKSPTARGNIIEKKASSGNLVGSVKYAGSMIPLIEYDVSPSYKRLQGACKS